MDVKNTLSQIIEAFKSIRRYANCIYNSADDDVKDIILAICNQEIKATEYDLDQYKLNELVKEGQRNENN